MGYDTDPDHPIIECPWTYQIIGFSYQRDPSDWADCQIDLVLERDGIRRRLRFLGPRDLRITEGFPSSVGLCIVDVSRRQLDGIGVRVANFEASDGCPEFWARQVIDLDQSDSA